MQNLGLTLKQIKRQLNGLPDQRTPTLQDWEKISKSFSVDTDKRIAALTQLREKLTGCIDCGCLSLKKCALYNKNDVAAERGAGPRFLMENP